MRRVKRFLALFTVIAMIIAILAACNKEETPT